MNKILLCWIFCTFIFLSCKIRNCNCDVSEDQLRMNDSMVNVFISFVNDDSLTHYERFFDRFNKSKLFEKKNECYRLSIRPPFFYYSTIYEICNHNNTIELSIEEFYKNENSSYTRKSIKQKKMTSNDWSNITKAIEENCFWVMKINEERSNEYLDPTIYLLDVYSGQTEPPIPVETEPLCFVI